MFRRFERHELMRVLFDAFVANATYVIDVIHSVRFMQLLFGSSSVIKVVNVV